MFQFKDKTVFIISPERWGAMKVSKHHYALQLAAMNCNVFFIQPPDLNVSGITVSSCNESQNIRLLSYKPIFRGRRFLPHFIFSFLLKWQVKNILKKTITKPDVIFCFQGYLFENLQWFGAGITIFFAADQFYYRHLPPEVVSADLLLSVSNTITEKLKSSGKNVYELGHGLQPIFVRNAEELLKTNNEEEPPKNIIVGYTGNLRMQALDRQTMRDVINANLEVTFIFWGSYKLNDLNLGGVHDDESDTFIRFLEEKENVQLRGVVDSSNLLQEIKICNMFWICWKIGINSLWDGSNSHKILEYMATGKPVVAHCVSSYKNTDLLYMLQHKENTGYEQLFANTLQVVRHGEPQYLIRQRLYAAAQNSYSSKLKTIELIAQQHGKEN